MKMSRAMVSLLAIAVLCTVPYDADCKGIQLRGGRSCEAWLRNTHSAVSIGGGDESWLIGFLSGIALMSERDFLRGTDNDAIFVWVDKYCQANPSKEVADAGQEFALELIRKKGLK